MPDVLLTSLRGGMNNTDPPLSLPDDQCVTGTNVAWVRSMLGERRPGYAGIDVAGSDLDGQDRITFLHRHLPTADETGSELWALGVTGTSSSALCRKDTAWTTVSPVDAITLTSGHQYALDGQTLHGKLFLAYKSSVDRLHVWDGTSLRRAGLAQPGAAPTAADSGGAGSLAGTRYYRVREVVLSGSTVLRRSEPSAVLTFAPDGAHAAITVTKPADTGEGATHWELEAGLTETGDYYRIARTAVATTTYADSVAYDTGYGDGTLSEDIGAYLPIPSARYLLADEDRLIALGSFEDDALASRVAWTPVYTDSGVGNDERVPLDPTSVLDLDTYEGGPITGGAGPVNGEIWVFKWSHIYKLVRTGNRQRAYDVVAIAKTRGAIPWSMVAGVDQLGSPCVYFLDPRVGPCRIGANGVVQWCGQDILTTWHTVNLDAAQAVARALYDDVNGQVHWFVATGTSDAPDTRLVLHVRHTRDTADGVRRGFAVWDGPSAAALATCLYADNIDADTTRSRSLVPTLGLVTGTIVQPTTETTDTGEAFQASVTTKPYAPATVLHQFAVEAGALVGEATPGAVVDVTVTRDFGLETQTFAGIDLSPQADETQRIAPLDQVTMSELRTVAFTISDPVEGAYAGWAVNQLVLRESAGQRG